MCREVARLLQVLEAAPAVAGHGDCVGAPPRPLLRPQPLAPHGPTAGTAALDPLEFLARLLTHIPDPGQVMTRYYGWYACRTRVTRARLAHLASDGRRLTADGTSVEEPVAITDPVDWSLRATRYRWAELLRRIYEVDPLACPLRR
jgi:hypothetical protein